MIPHLDTTGTADAGINVQITGYHLRFGGNRAVLELEGGSSAQTDSGVPLARFDFRPGATPLAFVNRGGFISVTRPMDQLAATMDMLRHDAPVYIDANGTLTTFQQITERRTALF